MEIAAPSPESASAAAQGKAPRSAAAAGDGKDASPFMALLAALQPAGEAVAEPAEAQAPTEEPVEAVPLVAPATAQAEAADRPAPADASLLGQGVRRAGSDAHTPSAQPAASDLSATTASDLSAEPEPVAALATRKPRALATAEQATPDAATSGQAGETRALQRQQAQADLQAAAADGRGAAVASEPAASSTAALAEAWNAAGRPQQAVRGPERHAERGAQPLSTVAMGVGGGDVPVQGNGAAMAPTAASAVVPAGGQATATLAQKMSFWSARGVQNASLELEAFDGAKVDVRIALQGREAKVEFRSDVPEARRWLQDALPQLEDMFQGEGLTLAGGFVGTSAGQDGRQGDAPSRDAGQVPAAARIGTVRVGLADAQALRTATSPAVARGIGQSVDLFV